MAGRVVYQSFGPLTVTADATQDIVSLLASATIPIRLLGFQVSSNAIAASIIRIDLHRITAVGSGGTSSTTEDLADTRFSAVTANIRTLDTTPGASGNAIMGHQWEQLGPWGHVFTPEMAPRAAVSNGFAIGWFTATSATVSGYICWEEL